MNINDLVIPKKFKSKIDIEKQRAEIRLNGDSGSIIAYYPTENLQVYVYNINGRDIPDIWDMGIRTKNTGQYFRTLICRHGHGEFTEDGINLNVSGGEFAMKYGMNDDNHFSFTTDSLLGVEIVLQAENAAEESILLRMLSDALRYQGISRNDFVIGHWYFSNYSKGSAEAIDRLIENCESGAESQLILINSSEIGYDLGNDYRGSEPKERKYPTNLQKAIAEDIHTQLTENYDSRLTGAMFAEKYGLSDSTVKNYFRSVYGYSFKEYQMKVRMEKAAELLENTDMKQVEIAMAVGYATQAKFINAFKNHYQLTPSEYRRIKKLKGIL